MRPSEDERVWGVWCVWVCSVARSRFAFQPVYVCLCARLGVNMYVVCYCMHTCVNVRVRARVSDFHFFFFNQDKVDYLLCLLIYYFSFFRTHKSLPQPMRIRVTLADLQERHSSLVVEQLNDSLKKVYVCVSCVYELGVCVCVFIKFVRVSCVYA